MLRVSRQLLAAAVLSAADIENRIRSSSALKVSAVQVKDTSSGCGSFFSIKVSSPDFEGKTLIQQHRLVNEVLKDEIKAIHGFTLETKTA